MPAASETTRMMPQQLREARLMPTTFNAETRTIEVVWGVGARVRRYDWQRDRFYDEELDMSATAVDMTRLASGNAAVLADHGTWSIRSQIGVVERAWIEKGEGRAVLRLSSRDDVAGLVEDIQSGIIRNVSVGYTVQRYEVDEVPGATPLYRAVEWRPHEISFVTVPADASAHARNDPAATAQGSPCVFTRAGVPAKPTSEEDMTTPAAESTRAADDAADVSTPQASGNAPAQPNIDHAARAAEIVELCNRHECAAKAAEWIRAGHSTDHVRGLILDSLAARDAEAGGNINRVQAGVDEADKFRAAGENLLLGRANVIDPEHKQRIRIDPANPLRGMTLLELARSCLERGGVSTRGLSKLEMVGRAFTQSTSDFPVLLENAMHKSLQAAYAIAPDTWSRFCRVGSVSDFRAHTRYRVGSLSNLDAVTELAEFKNKAIPDGEKSSITIGTKGNIINLSRQAIINDDLDAFVGLAATLGRAAKRTIEADVFVFLASNPTMPDGKALFHTDHGNIESAGAPTVTTVNAARVKLAKQKDVSGNDYLALTPAIWLGPLAYGADVRVLNDAQYDPDTANKLQKPNSVRGIVRDVIDTPRIATNNWYLFADPSDAPVIEVAFLDGQTEPFLDYEEGFSVDGARWKVRLDFGIAAIDYRGAVLNGS